MTFRCGLATLSLAGTNPDGGRTSMAYAGTHPDINMLLLFPWPDELRVSVSAGQLGRHDAITWRQYMAMIGEYWETSGRYPHHDVAITPTPMRVTGLWWWMQLFTLATRAMLEMGYVDPAGTLTPPIPFPPTPPEYPGGV